VQLQDASYLIPNICYLNRVGNYQNLGYSAAEAPDYPNGPDDDLLLRTLRGLRQAEGPRRPWFLWYHYKYVHLPYWPGPAYRRLFGIEEHGEHGVPARLRESVCSRFVVPLKDFQLWPEDRELVRRLYAAGVRQFDDFLARVIEELAQSGLLSQTTLVLTADHGDELLEHGHVGHASTAHHATLYEEVLRVPLIFIDPRIKEQSSAGRNIEERVCSMDLYPTLLSLCGVPVPAAYRDSSPFLGVDLSPLILGRDGQKASTLSDRAFYAHSARMGYLTPRSHEGHFICALSDGRQKYILEQYESTRQLLFDLKQDPQELEPITAGPKVKEAHAALLHFINGASERRNG
jgi:arylsulfatase A-like enzyme